MKFEGFKVNILLTKPDIVISASQKTDNEENNKAHISISSQQPYTETARYREEVAEVILR